MKAKQYEQEENFREVGFLSNLDMVWKETDFILVPSINEAFGRTPIESMQQGVFVVAHNSGGHRESIQHLSNGFLFDSFEYSECIKVFEKFTKNREKYAEIVHRAYKNTSEFNYVKKHSEKIMKIYKSLDV